MFLICFGIFVVIGGSDLWNLGHGNMGGVT